MEQTTVASAIEQRGCDAFQTRPQPLRIVGVASAHHPQTFVAPAFDCKRQRSTARQQRQQPFRGYRRVRRQLDARNPFRAQQIARTHLLRMQPERQGMILRCTQRCDARPASAECSAEQQDRLRIRRQFVFDHDTRSQCPCTSASASGKTGPLPASRKSAATTVNVHPESTIVDRACS